MTQQNSSRLRILVPLDGSDAASEILEHVRRLAAQQNAEVVLLRVIGGVAELSAGTHLARDVVLATIAEDRALARQYLEPIAERMRSAGVHTDIVVLEGSPAPAILHHLEGIDLIAMTTHSRRGIGRSLMGSVADEVIRESHIPVLVFHPKGEHRQRLPR